MIAGKQSRRFTAFTLIELLVVISIIAILMAILMPTLAKSKEQAKRAMCKSYLHGFIVLCTTYAHDYDGKLPSFNSPDGPHVHDLAENMLVFLEKDYSLDRPKLYCPSIPKWRVKQSLEREHRPGDSNVVGYNYWVQRYVGAYHGPIPPNVTNSVFTVMNDSEYIGPSKVYDKLGKVNPVITDQVSSRMVYGTNCNVGDNSEYNISVFCTHLWDNCVDINNQAYIDGHVEAVKGDQMSIQYGYGTSPDGSWIWR